MPFDLILHNATVVTANDAMEVIENGFVAVKDGAIAAIGPLSEKDPLPAGKERIDAGGGVVMPGLVNAHTHLPMTLFRGLADDLPLERWLHEVMFPAEATHIDPDSARCGALLACAEMLLSGTTCCCDGYFHADCVAEAVDKAGMRAVIGQGVIDFPAPGVPDPKKNVRHAATFVDQWKGRSERILPSIFCHSPYTCSAETLRAAAATARERGGLFQIHVSETAQEVQQSLKQHGQRPVPYLDGLGLLGENCLAVHCVWVDEEEIQTLAARRTAVAHCPSSNMKLGSGVAPVVPMGDAGVVLGMGTDGCASNNTLDMFREMNTAAKLHKVHRLDPTATDAETVLGMATIGSARAMGLGDRIGSIEVGKRADLIVIDTTAPHLTPMYSPVSHAVYAMTGGDVRDVLVDGRVLVRNRVLLSMDLEKIIADSRGYAQRIVRRG
ncbi:MAG: amidohydrolase [Desulfobacterales bacterium]|nr:amidohydrolase [Desulfobacterales bacterium]